MPELAIDPNDIVELHLEEDQEQYSRRVQKRINKLTGDIKSREQLLADERAARQLLEQENQRLRELHQKYESESSSQLDDLIKSKNARRLELLNEGDFENALKIEDEIFTLREQKLKPQVLQQQPKPEPTAQQQSDQVNAAMQAWYDANPWFDHDPKTKDAASRRVYDAFAELRTEGYQIDDPETYGELNKRLAQPAKESRPRQPSYEPGNDGGQASPPPARLTDTDLRNMRKYGLDPNNPVHRSRWNQSKARG
jgi:hypothetical protein